jgi:hypothetical protein
MFSNTITTPEVEPSTFSANEEGQNNSGNINHTILATSAVCYGVYMVDCYVVKLYRILKKWELSLTDEQKGNFISMQYAILIF